MDAINLLNPMALSSKTNSKGPADLRDTNHEFKKELQKSAKTIETTATRKPVSLIRKETNIGTKIATQNKKEENIEAEMAREFFASMLATADPLSEDAKETIDGGLQQQQQLFELWKLGLKNIEFKLKDDNKHSNSKGA